MNSAISGSAYSDALPFASPILGFPNSTVWQTTLFFTNASPTGQLVRAETYSYQVPSISQRALPQRIPRPFPVSTHSALQLSSVKDHTEKPEQPAASKSSGWLSKLNYLYPICAFTAAPLLLGANALKHTGLKNVFPVVSKKTLAKANTLGSALLAVGFVPKCLVQLQYGINANQPTMVLSQILNLTALPLLATGNVLATVVETLAGGMFTIGLANAMENQSREKQGLTPKRKSDALNQLAAALRPNNGEGGGLARTFTMGHQIKQALGFVIIDHIEAAKTSKRFLEALIKGENPLDRPRPIEASLNPDYDSKSDDSPILSRTGATCVYLASIPRIAMLLNSKAFPGKGAVQAGVLLSSAMAGTLVDMSMIMLGLKGESFTEKLPAIGSTLEYSSSFASMLPGSGPRMQAVQSFVNPIRQLGGAINTLYYKFQAEHAK